MHFKASSRFKALSTCAHLATATAISILNDTVTTTGVQLNIVYNAGRGLHDRGGQVRARPNQAIDSKLADKQALHTSCMLNRLKS